MTLVLIAIGAAIGAPLRFIVDGAITARARGAMLPWGLFIVNVVGSAVAALVLATTTGDLRLMLTIGLCGAFTTFSGFGWESLRLWSSARGAFWATVIGMPLACTAVFLLVWSVAGAVSP
jgi:CrcB protein